MTSVALTEAVLQQADGVVITAAHSAYDWAWIIKNSRLVVDTRNATRHITAAAARIVKL